MTKAKFITRAVANGHNPKEAATRLEELLDAHTGDNLIYALTYWGYATVRGATKYVEALARL